MKSKVTSFNLSVARKTILCLLTLVVMIFCSTIQADATVSAPPKVLGLKCIINSQTSVKLSWSKNLNVKGYQVYRKVPGGNWKKISTIKTNKNSFLNAGLKSGKTYYYKVRTYRTYKSNGKICYKYGKFSKYIKLTTRTTPVTYKLKGGYYTAGVDIPAGTFNVSGTAGIGYISSDNDAANIRGSEYDDHEYTRSYKNYKLSNGEILEVTGVQVKLSYTSVTNKANSRKYDENAGACFRPGNYIVGTDINPGRYCIKYLSGCGGYVSSDRCTGTCIVNSNMDGDPETGDYIDYVSNIILKKGETFEVSSGLKVMFIPEVTN